MLGKIFITQGRISRLGYFLSIIIFITANLFINGIEKDLLSGLSAILSLAIWWFFISQSVQRSHDVDHNGWFVLIPGYIFYLMVAKGSIEANGYGEIPTDVASRLKRKSENSLANEEDNFEE